MAFTIDDATRLEGADVFDENGEFIGSVRAPHILNGELLGVVVDLDEEIAGLPTVGRDHIEIGRRFIDVTGEDSVRVRMALMDAVTGHATPKEFLDKHGG